MSNRIDSPLSAQASLPTAPPVFRSAPLMDAEALRQVHGMQEQAYQIARQFESLLIEEVVKSARMAGGGWLGEDADSTSESVAEMGEQFLARALAAGGGMGLAAQFAPVILRDLQQSARPPAEVPSLALSGQAVR